jgi:cytidylate kinase
MEETNFNIEQYQAFMEISKEQEVKLNEYFQKVIEHKIEEKELAEKQSPLTRGEKKAFIKDGLDITKYQFMSGDYDKFLDALIKIRGIKKADDMQDSELAVWLDKVILRTLRPLDFEGN